MDWRRIRKE
eukprot:g2863.t1